MTQYGYALLGLAAIVAILAAVLTFSLLRIVVAARNTRHRLRADTAESPLLSAALHDAVTKLKAQEQAMSVRALESERLSDHIVTSLTAGLLLVDAEGVVKILNPAGQRMLGLDAAVGRDYREVLAQVQPLADAIGECLRSNTAIVRRSLELASGVRPTHLGVTVSPMVRDTPAPAARPTTVGGAPPPDGAICLFSDLSTVVELEERLRLKETLARLGELTAGIAHEFRNGLATIHGYSRLIDPRELPAGYQPYLAGIRQETDALGQVVTNFLNFARPEQMALAQVDLGAIVRRVADELRQEMSERATITVNGEFPVIQGDEVLLRQLVSNLIRNALEACEAADILPVVTVTSEIDGEHHLCEVRVDDNGPGIPEASRSRVFQPFFTTRSRGTGLGLAIVQKIAVLHNARVVARASASGGASIQLSFPLAA